MAVSGDLREMPLTTLISVNCTEHNQSRLRLQRGEQEAFIFFDNGQVVHITLGDHQGEETIYELLTWEEGSFELEMGVPPPARTVNTPWSNLVLDGMRVIDESEAVWEAELTELKEAIQKDSTLQEVNQMAKLQDLLQEMATDIPGFMSVSVVGMDGLGIATHATTKFNVEAASAQFALVMKLVKKSADQLKVGKVEDNLVTNKGSFLLARFLGDGSYYLGVAVDREVGSLGNVRLMTRQYADDLWDAIPRRKG